MLVRTVETVAMDVQGLPVIGPLGHARYDRVGQIHQFQGVGSVSGKARVRDKFGFAVKSAGMMGFHVNVAAQFADLEFRSENDAFGRVE